MEPKVAPKRVEQKKGRCSPCGGGAHHTTQITSNPKHSVALVVSMSLASYSRAGGGGPAERRDVSG